MPRTYSRKPKRRSQNQLNSLKLVSEARDRYFQGQQSQCNKENTPTRSTIREQNKNLKKTVKYLEEKVENHYRNYRNERRKNARLQGAKDSYRIAVKRVKGEKHQLQAELNRTTQKLQNVTNVTNTTIHSLNQTIKAGVQSRHELQRQNGVLTRRCKRATQAKNLLKKSLADKAKKTPTIFRLTHKGVYTAQARSLARHLVSAGAAEAKVGVSIQKIGEVMGVGVDRIMSKRTVQRAIKESGVAADIQIAYEMLNTDKLTFSSDSTSHRHIEYESRTIALKVVDYMDPTEEPKWKLRTLGVDTSVNHASETQFKGLKERLQELASVFNESPFAKRHQLHFSPDDFAFRIIGTSGDHAADQKKCHEMMKVWRMQLILRRLGEEALYHMEGIRVVALLLELKARQIKDCGGQEAWDKHTDEEKEEANIKIIEEIGKRVMDGLPSEEQDRLTRFIRTGCCMHKDLNSVKGGDKAMQEYWAKNNRPRPILLANKDNTAVLACRDTSREPNAAEKRAEEMSKRGGCHATMLGGLICRNKDKKKGQQDTYVFYMEIHVGHRVPYPDVSNTRYGTHGEAAGTIVVYRVHFIGFVEFVRDAKDKVGLTNIEKNFLAAIQNKETLTELCVLAFYFVAISRPFMQHVRKHDNILDLEGFFKKKVAFMETIIAKPEIWTERDDSHQTACLGGEEWDDWSAQVVTAVRSLAPELPDLKGCVVAFVRGAMETFTERFSDEFKAGGDIDKLTKEERKTLFFSSTNDINEGALGSWRLGQRKRPRETLHKFNAGFMASQNNTEAFHSQMLNTDEDEQYIKKVVRVQDKSGCQKKLKAAQIEADKRKVEENHAKESKRKEKRDFRVALIAETGQKLVLDSVNIDKLTVEELNRQLDFHREEEKKQPTVDSEKVPLKSHMSNKAERVAELKKAVARYNSRTMVMAVDHQPSTSIEHTEPSQPTDDDTFYESDYHDDDV